MNSIIPWRVIKYAYQAKDYVYAITLNPKVGIDLDEAFDSLSKYLVEHSIDHWLVKCKSDKNFIHWHGIVHFTAVADISKMKLALRNKVNRCLGRLPPACLVRPDNLRGWYEYVYSPRNIVLDNLIYHSPKDIDNVNKKERSATSEQRGACEHLSASSSDDDALIRLNNKQSQGFVECYD